MFKSFGLGFILGAGVGLVAAFLPTDDEKRCLKDDVKDYVDGTVNDSTTFSNNLTTFQDNLNNFSQQTPIATETLSSLQ
ncbi:YtxH domain-containing protein, partial [Lactobacillus mulieris]